MKHIFILNPAAGSKNAADVLRPQIEEAAKRLNAATEIYCTTAPGDGEVYVRNRLLASTDEILRFYACGGDGTLNEIINGAADFPNAQVACVPIGTGNDFVRNFTNKELFQNIENQISGEAEKLDLLSCNDRYSINMINIGFDCAVVEEAARLKRKGFSGFMAYIAGVFVVFVKKYGIPLKVRFNQKEEISGEMLLCAIANGGFCGGGFHSAADASLNDGQLDAYLIEKISRPKFMTLLGKYRTGTYIHVKNVQSFIHYKPCSEIEISGNSPLTICYDGEISSCASAKISIKPAAISFSVPKGCTLTNNIKANSIKREEELS